MNNKEVIHLMLSFSQSYVTPLFVLLTSIFENNKNNVFMIHAVTRANEKAKNKIALFVREHNSDVAFYKVDESLINSFVMPDDTNTHLTADTYNRLFVPSLIPQDIKKIIHLDIDTVVVGDLAKLFSVDTGTCPAAAVPDAGMYLRTDLDIHSIDGYFNAGVMLLNLDEWKKQRVSERTIDVIVNQAERIKRYVDQDALNLVLNNNWYKLERKFNLMGMYSPKDLGVADQDNYLEDIVVIHFNGPKPWNLLGDCDHRFGYLYHFYKGKSPVKGEKKYMDVSFSKDFLKRYSYAKIMKLYFANPLIGKIWRKIKTT